MLPLYARLSAAEQHRVFAAHPGRRVVLATNVAETSLTVPGIRYVVDAGTARISRYSARTKVQRLPIEPISQASANQRAGRCGRVAPGVCIRLYSEEDLLSRPEFTEPEILRTNLASVILQMTAARLGDIADFPFVEAPDRSQITDGLRLLGSSARSLTDGSRTQPRLTAVGHRLAAVPVDPRLGRMLLAGGAPGLPARDVDHRLRAVHPRPARTARRDTGTRRRPAPPVLGADAPEAPRRTEPSKGRGRPFDKLRTNGSDFVAWLQPVELPREAQKKLSGNGFRRLCREEFLHFLRVREWQDLHTQLKQICRELGLDRNDKPAAPPRVHTAALAGLLSHVGLADLREDPKAGRAAGAGADPLRGVPRRAGHPVRHQPRLQPGPDPAAAGGRGGDRGDQSAVGAYGRPDHRGAGRGGRPAPAQAAATPSRTGRPAAGR